MTVTSYADAITARTAAQIEAQLLADMTSDGVDVAGFGDFSVQRMIPSLQSRAQAALEQLRVQLVQAGTPTTAFLAGDDWVDVTLNGFFFETRIPASKAQQSFIVGAPSGSPLTASARGLVAQADDDTLFDSIEPANIPAGATRPVLFEARTAGIIGNTPTGLVSHLVVGPPGASIANPDGSLVLAGRDVESSADYLIRCLGKWGMQGRGGNRLAYYYLVPLAASTITRILVRDDNPFGPGTIGLCLANAAGPATQGECDAVASLLQPQKPLGSGALKVFAATSRIVTVTAQLVTDGSNGAAVANAIDALGALGSTYPIADPQTTTALFADRVVQTLMNVSGTVNLRGLSPANDTLMAPYQVVSIIPSITVAA